MVFDMGKKRPNNGGLPTQNMRNVRDYCASRTLDLFEFDNGRHMRVNDGNLTIVDIWPSTGKYWVKETNYEGAAIERGGETGFIPVAKEAVFEHLDEIFFAADMNTV